MNTNMKFSTLISIPLIFLGACAPTTHEIGYASENTIEIKYSAYALTPTLTAKATDMAVKHCAQFGKFANYQSATVPNVLSTGEVHTFACEKVKRNDAAVIQGDKANHTASANALNNILPTQTVCNDNGYGTTVCTSY